MQELDLTKYDELSWIYIKRGRYPATPTYGLVYFHRVHLRTYLQENYVISKGALESWLSRHLTEKEETSDAMDIGKARTPYTFAF